MIVFMASLLNFILTEMKELQMKKSDIQYPILNHYKTNFENSFPSYTQSIPDQM